MSERDAIVADLADHVSQQVMAAAKRAMELLSSREERVALLELVSCAVVGMASAELVFDATRDPESVSEVERCAAYRAVLTSLLEVVDERSPPDHRNDREVLAARRTGGSIDFHWQNGWANYTVGFTLYPGTYRCAEIFLNVAKSDGMAEANARDAGILASFALQHGAALERLVEAVTHESDGTASSIVGTALNLVAAEIAKMRGGEPNPASDPVPGAGPGDGSGNVRCSAAVPVTNPDVRLLASVEAEPAKHSRVAAVPGPLEPADPKEAQNDGDPVRATRMLWLRCETCGCRHDPLATCPDADAASRRDAQALFDGDV